ncbi:O-antigen flippase, partial [Vibrio parahaemolyticus]|nr:O-antigen flippase [Vibrio parahaemolyticus]
MNLIKTSFLTLIATAIRLISGLVINKAISVFIGPSGLALIGQFQNSLTV